MRNNNRHMKINSVNASRPHSRLLGQVPTKVGEIMQGVDRHGSPILVTATSNDGRFSVYSNIKTDAPFGVTLASTSGKIAAKAEEAVRRFAELRQLDLSRAPRIDLISTTPIGKGRASSSQDQQRALLDITQWSNIPTTVKELYSVMCTVERSDFMFRQNRLIRANPVSGHFQDLAPMPQFAAAVWDDNPSGFVDTAAVAYLDKTRLCYAPAYEYMVKRLSTGGIQDVFEVSTMSAALSQSMLPKKSFGFADDLARQLGGGVIVAHTGTIIGVLIPPVHGLVQEAIKKIHAEGHKPEIHTLGA